MTDDERVMLKRRAQILRATAADGTKLEEENR
jgi:hypothetical protein